MTDVAFRKLTPRVRKGLQYAIASLEFDAKHGLTLSADAMPGVNVKEHFTPETLEATAEWLKYQLKE